jgi:hypothetical protein
VHNFTTDIAIKEELLAVRYTVINLISKPERAQMEIIIK